MNENVTFHFFYIVVALQRIINSKTCSQDGKISGMGKFLSHNVPLLERCVESARFVLPISSHVTILLAKKFSFFYFLHSWYKFSWHKILQKKFYQATRHMTLS